MVPVLTESDQAKLDALEAGEEGSKEPAEGKAKAQAPTSSQIIERPADPLNAWSDYALSIGAELMQKCRRGVLQQLGYTCSAGVARNKVRLYPLGLLMPITHSVFCRYWPNYVVLIGSRMLR